MDKIEDFLTAPSLTITNNGETADLNGQAIFSMGIHKGNLFVRDDLDKIVENFYILKNLMKVPAKLGHGEENYGTRNGYPAVGWVKDVKRNGPYLIADFTDVPIVVAKAIQRKQYLTKSSELLIDVDWGFEDAMGRELGIVLTGVAFLGEEMPAVPDLNNLDSLFTLENSSLDFSKVKSYSLSFGHDFKEETDKLEDKTEGNTSIENIPDTNTQPDENSGENSDTQDNTENSDDENKDEFNSGVIGVDSETEEDKEEIDEEAKQKEFYTSADRIVKILDSLDEDGTKIEEYKIELDGHFEIISGYDMQKNFNDFWGIFKMIDDMRSLKWISKNLSKHGYKIPEIPEIINEDIKKDEESENKDNSSEDFNKENKEREEFNMDEKMMKEAIDKATDAVEAKFSAKFEEVNTKLQTTTDELNTTKEELRGKESENSKLNATVMELAKESEVTKEINENSQIDNLVGGWVKEGKVLPRQVEEFKALLKSSTKVSSKINFSRENEAGEVENVEKSNFELLNDIVNGMPKQVNFSETAEEPFNEKEAPVSAKERALEIAAQDKKNYKKVD